MPNNQKKTEELLTVWRDLRERILSKINQLEESNYILEKEKNDFTKQVAKFAEIPIEDFSFEKAVNFSAILRIDSAPLSASDRSILEELNFSCEVFNSIFVR